MSKARLPVCLVFALVACGTVPAGAVVVLQAAPQVAADSVVPAPRKLPVAHVEARTMDFAGWGLGIAALAIAGLMMRRRTPGRIVSS